MATIKEKKPRKHPKMDRKLVSKEPHELQRVRTLFLKELDIHIPVQDIRDYLDVLGVNSSRRDLYKLILEDYTPEKETAALAREMADKS